MKPDPEIAAIVARYADRLNEEIESVEVDGEPLSPTQVYKVALPEFLLTGGNGYTMFEKGEDARYLGTTISSIVIAALEEMGTVSKAADGRIVVK